MKKTLFLTFFSLFSIALIGQEKQPQAFKEGEWLHYRMSYSGFLKAGTADLELKKTLLDGKTVYHAKGFGKTSAFIGWFFKVRDTYESYFDTLQTKPYLFKRDVYEGGHTIIRDTKFDYDKNKATVIDHKRSTTKEFPIANVQDMISAFYYLRNQNVDSLKVGDEIDLNMFFDSETFPFKLRFLGKEILKTRFGKIRTLKFRPLVQAGRVFKESESVTIWVTADDNRIPILLKASLAVGSLKAELKSYKGLANSFEIIFD